MQVRTPAIRIARARRSGLFVLLLLNGGAARAQERFVRTFGPEAGLTSPPVWDVAQDSVGFLWIGTEGGLFRFDGTEFRRWAPDSIRKPVSNVTVRAAHAASGDRERRRSALAGVARTVLDLVRRIGPEPPAGGAGRFELTDRELDVRRCLVDRMSYKRTARHLEISIDTVRGHIRSVYSKLQVHNVAEAVSRALREGIVQVHPLSYRT